MTTDSPSLQRVPVRPGLFADGLDDLTAVRLAGSRCGACAEVQLGGDIVLCPNCGGETLEPVSLSSEGKLWTYTMVRSRPPGDYKGPDPFVATPLGLVELPDGLRVLAPLGVSEDALCVGMHLELRAAPLYVDDEGREVIAFSFVDSKEGVV